MIIPTRSTQTCSEVPGSRSLNSAMKDVTSWALASKSPLKLVKLRAIRFFLDENQESGILLTTKVVLHFFAKKISN